MSEYKNTILFEEINNKYKVILPFESIHHIHICSNGIVELYTDFTDDSDEDVYYFIDDKQKADDFLENYKQWRNNKEPQN